MRSNKLRVRSVTGVQGRGMSALGQKRTCAPQCTMSFLTRKQTPDVINRLTGCCNFWLRNIDTDCFIYEPDRSGPCHGGQHDNRSNNCNYSGGLCRDEFECTSRGRQAENRGPYRARRLCVLGAGVRRRYGLRPRYLCAVGGSSPVAHRGYRARSKDRQYQFVLWLGHAV